MDCNPLSPFNVLSFSAAEKKVLVEGAGGDLEDKAWEDYEVLQQEFPKLNLENKVVFRGRIL